MNQMETGYQIFLGQLIGKGTTSQSGGINHTLSPEQNETVVRFGDFLPIRTDEHMDTEYGLSLFKFFIPHIKPEGVAGRNNGNPFRPVISQFQIPAAQIIVEGMELGVGSSGNVHSKPADQILLGSSICLLQVLLLLMESYVLQ